MTRLLIDPAADFDDPGAVTITATLLDPGPSVVRTFEGVTTDTVVDLPAPDTTEAWRLTIRRPTTTINRWNIPSTNPGPIVEERTVHFPDGDPITWAALTDVDPGTLRTTAVPSAAWDAAIAELRAEVDALPEGGPGGFSGAYADLTGLPTIPVAPADIDAEPAGLSTATKTVLDGTYLPRTLASGPQLRQVQKKVAAQNAGIAQVKILNFGDSYAQKLWNIRTYLITTRALGGMQAGAIFGGVYGVSVNTSIGTITDNTADFAHWPSGGTSTLGAGATRTFGMGGGSAVCNTIKVYWINSGGGFKVQVDGVDNTTPTVGTDGSLGAATISVSRGAHTVTIAQTAGTPTIIGAGFIDTTINGVVSINVAQGGIALDSATAQAWGNFAAFLTDLQPDLMSFEMKENDPAVYATALSALFTATSTAVPQMDVTGIGSPPIATDDASQVAQNAALRTACARYGYIYWDSYSLFKDYAALTAMGMAGDGTHVSTDGDYYRAAVYLRDFGFLSLPGRPSPLDTFSDIAAVNTRLLFGKTQAQGTPVFELDADLATDLDASLILKRQLHVRAAGSGTDMMMVDSRNGSGAPSMLPLASQFGSGMAGIVGDSNSQVSFRAYANGTLNNWGTARAIAFIPAIYSADVAGTYTVPVTQGSVFRLSPTASGVVIDVANGDAITDGQEISIEVIRWTTNYSYSFSGRFKFPGNVAPTIGTAVGTRDIYRFRFAGSWLAVAAPMIAVG